jgi:chromosome segregation ATPase
MSFQSLQNKLSQLQEQIEEKSQDLDLARTDKNQALREKQDLENQLKLSKEEVDRRLLEIRELKNQSLEEKNKLVENLDSARKSKEKEKTAIEIEYAALREHISVLQEKEKNYQRLKERANILRKNLSQLKAAQKGLTARNYQLFCDRQSNPYPREGTTEVKLAWIEAFHQFVENVNRL